MGDASCEEDGPLFSLIDNRRSNIVSCLVKFRISLFEYFEGSSLASLIISRTCWILAIIYSEVATSFFFSLTAPSSEWVVGVDGSMVEGGIEEGV